MSPSILKSANLSKSVGKQLSEDPRLVSYRIHSVKGVTITAEGELQTLVELMMMQTAKVADSIGAALSDSEVRFLQISSGYYNAYFYQNAEMKVGAIAENAMTLGEFKDLIHG